MEYFDLHCDTVTKMYDESRHFAENTLDIDFERMKKYKAYTQVFAIFTPPEKRSSGREYTEECIDFFYGEMEQNGVFVCKNYRDFENAKGRYRAFLSLEGAEGITELSDVGHFRERGVFMIAPTWNFKNKIACGVMEAEDTGLTDFGKKVIAEMDRQGIILDMSHMSEKSFREAADIFKRPICASHSNLRAVTDHKRNLADEQFSVIKKTGGTAGLNFYSDFAGEDITAHIDRFLALGGEDNISIGSDFDGGYPLVRGISGIEDIEAFIRTLPYPTAIRKKLAQDNFLRVLRAYC